MDNAEERPPRGRDLTSVARGTIDSNLYLTLATADGSGLPWASPVYFAAEGYREFYWVSCPEATHSRNIAARPDVAIVIFDSRAPIGSGQGVYVAAVAEEVGGDDLEGGISIFSRRSEAQGAGEWTSKDVPPAARHRLYRATASELFVLGEQDRRTPVSV